MKLKYYIHRDKIHTLIHILLFTLVYDSVSEISLYVSTLGEMNLRASVVTANVACLWPAAGVGFAALFIWGLRLWPGIWLSEASNLFVIGAITHKQFITATGTTLATVISVWAVRHFIGREKLFTNTQHVVVFIVFGALLTSALSATSGVGALYICRFIEGGEFLSLWWTWNINDIVGILVVAPLIISYSDHQPHSWYQANYLETLLFFLSLSVTAWLVFAQPIEQDMFAYPLGFFLMPFSIWTALRFGQRETTLAIFILSGIAVFGTLNEVGPFVRSNLYESLLLLQTFLAMTVVTALFLTAALNERSQFELSLRKAQALLKQANEELEQRVQERTEALRRTTEKYESIFINAIEGIYQISPSGALLSINPALARMYGYETPEEMTTQVKDMNELYVDRHHVQQLREQILMLGSVNNVESEVRRKQGDTLWVAENSRAVCDRQGQLLYYEGTLLDVTHRRQVAEQLLQLAHHDALTGLANRRLFELRLKQALTNARLSNKRGVLMYFDLDGFKKVNDSLGHEWGDELLKEVARRLKSCLRESDTVCRLGGDEFTVIAENVNRTQDAMTIASKILNQISQPFMFEGKKASVGASIGIVFFSGIEYNLEQLIREADESMYKAKQTGSNVISIKNKD